MTAKHGPHRGHARQIAIGVSLAVAIVLAGTFALLRYFPLMVGVEMESNPIPVWTQVMVGGMFVVAFGSFVGGLYREWTTDDADDEPSGEYSDGSGIERLKAEYASGHIDENEFRRRLSDADSDAGRSPGGAIARGNESRAARPGEDAADAEGVLKRRLAAGELTPAEYERRMELLRD